MNLPNPNSTYEDLLAEYKEVMADRTWNLGWAFFFVFVGLLPLMYVFVWIVGADNWEDTFFNMPPMMALGSLITLATIVFLLFRIYKINLAIEETKQAYLKRLSKFKETPPKQTPSEIFDEFST